MIDLCRDAKLWDNLDRLQLAGDRLTPVDSDTKGQLSEQDLGVFSHILRGKLMISFKFLAFLSLHI